MGKTPEDTVKQRLGARFWEDGYLLRARAWKSFTSSSVPMSRSWSRSTPRKENFLNVLLLGAPPTSTASEVSACPTTKTHQCTSNQEGSNLKWKRSKVYHGREDLCSLLLLSRVRRTTAELLGFSARLYTKTTILIKLLLYPSISELSFWAWTNTFGNWTKPIKILPARRMRTWD